MSAQPSRPKGAAAGERGLAEVGGRSGTQIGVWLGLGAITLLGLGALGISAPSAPNRAPAAASREPVVRTEPPQLETELAQPPLSAAPAAAQSQALAAAALPAAEPAPDANPYLAQLAAELRRMKLEAAHRRAQRDERRRRSSMVVLDRSAKPSAAPPRIAAGAAPGAALDEGEAMGASLARDARAQAELGREERFARRVAIEPVETVHAQRLEHPETVVPQGTLIRGVLETAIQSDLPGFVRAQVSEPVLSFTGELVVPRGSTLIGRYQSGLVQGQTRVFVIWQRLLRPDGISIQLASPATDALGRAGVTGKVNTKFFQRFKGSLLLSLLDGGLAIAAARVQTSDGATVVNAGGQDLQRAAEIALQSSVSIPPTVEVPRGTPVQVFVSRDLDFMEPVMRERGEGL